jgi:nucleoside-diphosphate-sugar epimerase
MNAEDVARCILALLDRRYQGIINIGSGQGITVERFVQGLSDESLRIKVLQEQPPTKLVADITRLRSVLDD